MTMKRLVTGLLRTPGDAEAAVQRILNDGHVLGDISLMMSDKALPQAAVGAGKGGVIVAGPIAAELAGAPAGDTTGGLLGALIDTGVPPPRAELYETGLQKGGILVGVHARSKAEVDRLEWIFEDFGAEHVRVGNTGEDPSDAFDWRPLRL
jgi:hypothetical protein